MYIHMYNMYIIMYKCICCYTMYVDMYIRVHVYMYMYMYHIAMHTIYGEL